MSWAYAHTHFRLPTPALSRAFPFVKLAPPDFQRTPAKAHYSSDSCHRLCVVGENLEDLSQSHPQLRPMNAKPLSSGKSSQWLGDKLILPVYQDPECGDAICQGPFEYMAWGKTGNLHGCAPDCGFREDLTPVTVSLDYSAPEANGAHPHCATRMTNVSRRGTLKDTEPLARELVFQHKLERVSLDGPTAFLQLLGERRSHKQ
jgi:hypothetical protein